MCYNSYERLTAYIFLEVAQMKKAYIAPEAEIVSLAVEDVTNALELVTGQDDHELSLGNELSELFG